MERIFHAVCAGVLALSIVAFIEGGDRETLTADPPGDLAAFLRANGAVLGEPRPLLNDEFVMPLTLPGCDAPGRLVYMPVIHRISDLARAQWQGAAGQTEAGRDENRVVFVHDRGEVASLAAWRIIPRWLARRLVVNFQLTAENPWISIAFALVPPKACTWPKLDWSRLSALK